MLRWKRSRTQTITRLKARSLHSPVEVWWCNVSTTSKDAYEDQWKTDHNKHTSPCAQSYSLQYQKKLKVKRTIFPKGYNNVITRKFYLQREIYSLTPPAKQTNKKKSISFSWKAFRCKIPKRFKISLLNYIVITYIYSLLFFVFERETQFSSIPYMPSK